MSRITSVCVYCGSRVGGHQGYRGIAAALGRRLAERGIGLVYGGGQVGLMGVAADAALAAGGRVTGIIPGHLHDREVSHGGVSELVIVDSMHARKTLMFERADAFVTLPGGLGTLDETIEIITWRQLGLHDKPIFLLNEQDYWRPFLALVEHVIGHGFAGPGARALFQVVDDLDALMRALEAMPAPAAPADSDRL